MLDQYTVNRIEGRFGRIPNGILDVAAGLHGDNPPRRANCPSRNGLGIENVDTATLGSIAHAMFRFGVLGDIFARILLGIFGRIYVAGMLHSMQSARRQRAAELKHENSKSRYKTSFSEPRNWWNEADVMQSIAADILFGGVSKMVPLVISAVRIIHRESPLGGTYLTQTAELMCFSPAEREYRSVFTEMNEKEIGPMMELANYNADSSPTGWNVAMCTIHNVNGVEKMRRIYGMLGSQKDDPIRAAFAAAVFRYLILEIGGDNPEILEMLAETRQQKMSRHNPILPALMLEDAYENLLPMQAKMIGVLNDYRDIRTQKELFDKMRELGISGGNEMFHRVFNELMEITHGVFNAE